MAVESEKIKPLKVKAVSEKPGIIYLSRIPPAMNPLKIRSHFAQYGEVGRLFLQPEDPLIRRRRKKTGGNSRKQFTEGWVEYKNKKLAKEVAATLNNTIQGGKKGNYHHDDIWNIKYLSRFKWTHISEKLAYEKAAREQRMRTEIAQVKREANAYLENVDKGNEISAIEKKKSKKRKMQGIQKEDKSESKMSKIHQKPVVAQTKSTETSATNFSSSLLSKILTSG